MKETESSSNSERRIRSRQIVLALFVTGIMVATAFAVTVTVMDRSRADLLSGIPLQWQRYVNAAIDNGDISKDASSKVVKDWLTGRVSGMSEKVKQSWVNPFGAKKVAAREAADAVSDPEPPVVSGTGKVLVILVEFTGTDTYNGVTYTGPVHNQIPQPAPDNNVDYWVSDYNTQHYMDLLFGSDGLTMKNYYEKQSNGLFTVGGFVSAWVQITDHSGWWYGADSAAGEGSDDLNGDYTKIAVDATKAAYAQYGSAIPWADYDVDKDGWIDSLMVVRAGIDQSAGGPSWTMWAHSSFANAPNGYEIDPVNMPGLKIGPYTTEPENEAVGVYAHEYAHQLGLPDEYDGTYIGESPVGFLSLMASGSWGPGPTPDGRMALGVSPCDIDVWGKYVLGWENGAVKYFDYSDQSPVSGTVALSQVEGDGTTRAIKVELPLQSVNLGLPKPKTGDYQWYSGFKPSVTDVIATEDYSSYMLTMKQPVLIPDGAQLWFWEWYDLEAYFDFAFVEVSTDNGVSWASLPGKHTTNDNPNGGNPGNGITGSSKHLVKEKMSLGDYSGKSILLRFRLMQDPYVSGLGWTVDDIRIWIPDTEEIVWSDPVGPKTADMWITSATDMLAPGWSMVTASAGAEFRHYYIMEWRNFVGFDSTLGTSYQYVGDYVQFWSHTLGLLVWYRNFAVSDNLVGLHPGRVAIGVVDSHPEPLYWPSGNFLRQRLQLMDAAFTVRPTVANTITLQGVPTTFPSLPAQPTFDDSHKYFFTQSAKGSWSYTTAPYCGLIIPTYGVTAKVLSESSDLTGAKVLIDAAPPA